MASKDDKRRDKLQSPAPNAAYLDNYDAVFGQGRNYTRTADWNIIRHLYRQREWSFKTFGPPNGVEGVIDHLELELEEIRAEPRDVEEWVDVIILAFDGAMRMGHTPEKICDALFAKQKKNEGRRWPDWRTATPGKAIEHIED